MPRARTTPAPTKKARLVGADGRVPTAITASAERGTNASSSNYRRLIQPWQQDAFRFYATVGECWYATQFYARLSKLRLFAAYRNQDGEIEPADENDPLSGLLDRIQDPGGGGYSELLGSYGRLMFLAGEGYLTVTNEGQDDEAWEFLSCNELRAVPGNGGYVRYTAPSLPPEQLSNAPDDDFEPVPGTAVVWRIWKRAPEFSRLADSPMRAVLDLFQELLLLQLAVQARAKSRAAGAGILYVPEELSFATPTGTNDEDPEQDPFQARLQQVMVAPISDPGSASAVVPAVIRGPANIGGVPAKDALFHLQIHDPLQTYPEEGLRTECIRRIATGLDMPAEELLGKGDSNHWSGWIIDDDAWRAHLDPLANQLVNNLAAAYLRPAAKKEGIERWREVCIGFDPAGIINHPDQSKDAKDVWDRGGIGYPALRAATNFTEDDAQTEEEHQEYLARVLRDPLSLPAEEDQGGASGSTGTTQQGSETTTEEPPNPDTSEQVNLQQEENQGTVASLEGLMGAAEMANMRTRELAGARLLRFARKECPDCVSDLDVPKSLLASAIGPEMAAKQAGGVAALLAGGAEAFQEIAPTLWGITPEAAERLAILIERHAGEHLFGEAKPLPPGFRAYASRLLPGDGRQSLHAAA